jgi:acyl transferase domain-containing protein
VAVYVGMLTQPVEGVVHSNSEYAPTHANASSGLVSFTFGLNAACLTLDTACSTQLAAVHLARAELGEH